MKRLLLLAAVVLLVGMTSVSFAEGTYCTKCGQFIQAGANFCPNCGNPVSGGSSAVRATLTETRMPTRTGPGTGYDEPGSFLSKGDAVTVLSKVWDEPNQIYWIQVEFTAGKKLYRGYTGSWRFGGLDVSGVRTESAIGSCVTPGYTQTGYYGPGYNYKEIKEAIPANTACTIYALENDFLQLEFYDASTGQQRRAWVLEPFVDNYTLWNTGGYNY